MQRGWQDHHLFAGDEYSRRDAWEWLVANAAWKDTSTGYLGKKIPLKRGQLSHSVRFLAEKWGWSAPKVQRFLCSLKTDTMIDTESDTGRLTITICNYDKFQSPDTETDTPPESTIDTAAIQQRYKEEEGKKERTISEDKSSSIEGEPEKPKVKTKKSFAIPDWVDLETWNAVVEMRRKMPNAPFTDDAKRLALRDLEALRSKGHDPTAVMEQTIQRGYRGFFPIKPDEQNGNTYAGSAKTRPTATHARFEQQDYRAGTEGFEVT